MDIILVSDRGFEQECKVHAQYLGAQITHIDEPLLIGKTDALAKLAYHNQSALKIGKLLGNEVEKIDWTFLDTSFKVIAKDYTGKYTSQEKAREVGEHIFKKTNVIADMRNPKYQIIVFYTNNDCYICLDVSKIALQKREYRVFLTPHTVRSTIAFNLLTFAQYKPDDVLVDPFCASGMISIEAALFTAGKSPHHYKKEQFFDWIGELTDKESIDANISGCDTKTGSIESAKKNAKIAGVKNVTFFKCSPDWLDMQFESVDCFVSAPPLFSSHNGQRIINMYKAFFKRALEILADEGRIVFLTNDITLVPIPEEFKVETKSVMMGNSAFTIVKLTRK